MRLKEMIKDEKNFWRPGLVHWCYCLPLIGPWTVALDCNIKTITMLNVKDNMMINII